MKPLRTLAAALLAAVAAAEGELDSVRKAIDDLGAREGYVVEADWSVEAVQNNPSAVAPEKASGSGTVKATVDNPQDFIRLEAHFEKQDIVVYRRGDLIAGQDPDGRWGSMHEDAKARFVTRMFDLKRFLAEIKSIAKDARTVRSSDPQATYIVEITAKAEELKKLVNDAGMGEAAVGAKLDNPTMLVRVEIARATSEVRLVEIVIEGDTVPAPVKEPPKVDPGGEIKEWDPDEEPGRKPEEKKPEPKPEPAAPKTEHVKIQMRAKPNFSAAREFVTPEEVKKILKIGG
jgi:hypothetical protein